MRLLLTTVLAVALPGAVMAFEQSGPGRLIAALSGDWNGDDMPDAVLLVQAPEDAAEIRVHLGDFTGLQPAFTVPRGVFAGDFGGQTPGLEALTATSFAITSEQTGVGRTPWTQQLTIAFRNDAFVVAGFTHAFYDRLDLDHHGSCDVNLLTGDYTLSLAPGDGQAETRIEARTEPQAFPLADLTEGYTPPVCSDLYR